MGDYVIEKVEAIRQKTRHPFIVIPKGYYRLKSSDNIKSWVNRHIIQLRIQNKDFINKSATLNND